MTDEGPKRRTSGKPMIQAERGVTFRDFLIFQLKILIDAAKDGALLTLSWVAIVLDFIQGRGKKPRLFYTVLRHSERFDLWLNLNGALEKLEAGEVGDDGLFGASEAGSDSLLGQIEQLVRGGDRPRKMQRQDRAAEASSSWKAPAGPAASKADGGPGAAEPAERVGSEATKPPA